MSRIKQIITTRAILIQKVIANLLLPGELYVLSDEGGRLVVATSANTYTDLPKLSEIGQGGGSLPTDNWLLGDSVDLYDANSLGNVVHGESIDFSSKMLNNHINGSSISDNGTGNLTMENNRVNGADITMIDVLNSSVSGKTLSVCNMDGSSVTGEGHSVTNHPDGIPVKNIDVKGTGVKNPFHSHAEYLAHGLNDNYSNFALFQNTRFTAKQRYIIQDGRGANGDEVFFLNVNGLLDPCIILIDPSVQFVSMDMHLTFQFSHLDIKTCSNYIDSITSAKAILVYDLRNDVYQFRFIEPTVSVHTVDLVNCQFISHIQPTLFQGNQGYLELLCVIAPIHLIQMDNWDTTGYTLDVFATIEMHTLDNGVNWDLEK